MHRDLGIAISIGDELCRTAFESGGLATWMGTERSYDEESFAATTRLVALGPTLYSGTAGVGLFLAELADFTGDRRHRELAEASLRHAWQQLPRIPSAARFGFFSGHVGVAWSLLRFAELTGADEFADASRAIATSLSTEPADFLLDVIAGAAGAAPALLAMSRHPGFESLRETVQLLGRAVVDCAQVTDIGWCWGERASGEEFSRPLTGFAHGASGIGWSLLLMHHALGVATFLEGAREAFRYERHWFDAARRNWPDFRTSDGTDGETPFGVSWCHGAPGIALARLDAWRLSGDPLSKVEAESAVATAIDTLRDPEEQNEMSYTLCHGQLGLAEVLDRAGVILQLPAAVNEAAAAADRGARLSGGDPRSWSSGVGDGANPSLMLGLAGIGHSYLRRARPDVPSVLLCGDRTRV